MAGSTQPTADPTRKAAFASGRFSPMTATSSIPAALRLRFARPRFQPRRRHLLLVVGLWLAIVGNAEAKEHGIGIAEVLVFSLLPSLPLLLGIGQRKRPGHLAARAVRPFNATHEPVLPLAVFALGAAGMLQPITLAGGLVWLGSIVIAWGLGDGLREADGALRPGLRRMTSWPSTLACGLGLYGAAVLLALAWA